MLTFPWGQSRSTSSNSSNTSFLRERSILLKQLHCTFQTPKASIASLPQLNPLSAMADEARAQVELRDFKNIFTLEGKVAVVTGGSRGLGLHAASGYIHSLQSQDDSLTRYLPVSFKQAAPKSTSHPAKLKPVRKLAPPSMLFPTKPPVPVPSQFLPTRPSSPTLSACSLRSRRQPTMSTSSSPTLELHGARSLIATRIRRSPRSWI
jgi:hypothetical protein